MAHTVQFGWPPAAHPQTSITLSAGDELLVRMQERCTFSLMIEPDAKFGDPSVLTVVEAHPLARGVQGTAWTIFRAVHAGTTRVVAFGGCAIPSPMPVEPSGLSLICDDVGYGEEVSVTVR